MPVIYNKKVEYAYTDPGVKAHTLSWAEYQALSEDDKMNGDLYFIPDKQPEGNPSRIWTKLGTDPLTTQADDVSGAVNELNSSLNSTDSIVSILNTKLKTNAVSSVDAVLDRAVSVEDGSICIMNGVSSLGATLSGLSATCMLITKNVGGSGRVDYFCIQGQGGKIALGSINTSTKTVTIKWTN